jgi:hypothetical protein
MASERAKLAYGEQRKERKTTTGSADLGPDPDLRRNNPKLFFRCPVCGHSDKASIREREGRDKRGFGVERWWVGCLHCDKGERDPRYLKALARAVGCRPIELLERADEILADLLVGQGPGLRGPVKPIPSEATFAKYHEALLASNGPLAYLTGVRGVSSWIVRTERIGLNKGGRLTFPMFDGDGKLVAYKTRAPRPGGNMRSIGGAGRAWPLYPWPDERAVGEDLLLCAGELDALCALSFGLDACSVTLGAGAWSAPWTPVLQNRRVLICFDNNELDLAEKRRDALLPAGVRARVIDLRKLGLAGAKADLSDYLTGGGAPQQLPKGAT